MAWPPDAWCASLPRRKRSVRCGAAASATRHRRVLEPSACVAHSTRGRWMGGALRSVPTLGARPAVPEDDPDADPCKCG
jgi:hypothetical protein